jgi:hypothetical protein
MDGDLLAGCVEHLGSKDPIEYQHCASLSIWLA